MSADTYLQTILSRESVDTRERLTAFTSADEAAIEKMQKEYRDFVALCAEKEDETGIPCLIVTSS